MDAAEAAGRRTCWRRSGPSGTSTSRYGADSKSQHRRRHDLRWFARGAALATDTVVHGPRAIAPGRGRPDPLSEINRLIASRVTPRRWWHVAARCPAASDSSHCSAGPPLRCSRARPPPRCRGRRRSPRRLRRPRVRARLQHGERRNTVTIALQTFAAYDVVERPRRRPLAPRRPRRAAVTGRAVPLGGCGAGVAAADLAPGLMREAPDLRRKRRSKCRA
jgi:hypothetical protein